MTTFDSSQSWHFVLQIFKVLTTASWYWKQAFCLFLTMVGSVFCLLGQYLPQSFYHSAWANLTSRLLYSECGQWSAGHSLNPPTKSKFSQHFLHQHEFWCQWNFPSIDGKTKTARTFSCTLLLSDLQYTCASFFFFFHFIFFHRWSALVCSSLIFILFHNFYQIGRSCYLSSK